MSSSLLPLLPMLLSMHRDAFPLLQDEIRDVLLHSNDKAIVTEHSMISLVVSLQCIRVHSPNGEASEAILVVFNQCLAWLDLRRTLGQVSLKKHWHSCHLRDVLNVVVSRLSQLDPAEVFLLVCSLVIT